MFKINNQQFTYAQNYKDDQHLRHSLNALTQSIYGFNFEQWYQDGYWRDRYVPHSLLHENTIVANASVSMIDFDLMGQRRKYIQIGTVMTAPEYRKMGLSRFLMEKIMAAWKDKCDMIYLFANSSVLSFYPRFGFEKAFEFQLSKDVAGKTSEASVIAMQKVDMEDGRNRLLLTEKVKQAKSLASLAMTDNPGLIMFYLTSFMKDNVYYLAEYDTYVIFEMDGDVVYLCDVFGGEDITFDEIIGCITARETKTVILGFTPKHEHDFRKEKRQGENDVLFVYGNDARRFTESEVMFPMLSHT